jgi:hypothetical protein
MAGMQERTGAARIRLPRGRRAKVVAVIGVAVVGIALLSAAALIAAGRGTSGVPDAIKREAVFRIWVPQDATPGVVLRQGSVKYDPSDGALSYILTLDGVLVTMSEQAAPDSFSDPGVYDFKLQQAREFESITTAMGDVALTKPVELNGRVVAMVWGGDVLAFANPDTPLSDAQWKRLFDSLVSVN